MLSCSFLLFRYLTIQVLVIYIAGDSFGRSRMIIRFDTRRFQRNHVHCSFTIKHESLFRSHAFDSANLAFCSSVLNKEPSLLPCCIVNCVSADSNLYYIGSSLPCGALTLGVAHSLEILHSLIKSLLPPRERLSSPPCSCPAPVTGNELLVVEALVSALAFNRALNSSVLLIWDTVLWNGLCHRSTHIGTSNEGRKATHCEKSIEKRYPIIR